MSEWRERVDSLNTMVRDVTDFEHMSVASLFIAYLDEHEFMELITHMIDSTSDVMHQHIYDTTHELLDKWWELSYEEWKYGGEPDE